MPVFINSKYLVKSNGSVHGCFNLDDFIKENIEEFLKENENIYNSYTSNHVLELNDVNKTVEINSSTAVNVIIPSNSEVPFEVGTRIDLLVEGIGGVYITAMSNVTINSTNSFLKLGVQYSKATLIKRDTDTWLLSGDIVASDKTDLALAFSNVPYETEYTYDIDAGTIDVLVPSGTVISALIAVFVTSVNITSIKIGEVSQVSGITENDFALAKTYTIIAQDGTTTKDWVVTVTIDS